MILTDSYFKNASEVFPGYSEIHFDTWGNFINFLCQNLKPLTGCIYRGQANIDWKLEASLSRLIRKSGYDLNSPSIRQIIDQHLNHFKHYSQGRHAIPYDVGPEVEDEIWWALGQHHGLATPLLDWVKSPYVATFFSFEQEFKDFIHRAVFALDLKNIQTLPTLSGRILHEPSLLTHHNKRQISQQATFTLTYDENIENFLKDFCENLIKCSAYEHKEIFLLKIKLPEIERDKILQHLDLMNINRATLFPDTSGAAKYCNYLLMNTSYKKLTHPDQSSTP